MLTATMPARVRPNPSARPGEYSTRKNHHAPTPPTHPTVNANGTAENAVNPRPTRDHEAGAGAGDDDTGSSRSPDSIAGLSKAGGGSDHAPHGEARERARQKLLISDARVPPRVPQGSDDQGKSRSLTGST